MESIPVRFNSVANLPVLSPDPSLESYDHLLSPDAVHVRLSAKCNLECDFCERMSWLRGDKDSEQDMELPVWEAIRDKIMPNVKGVEICGLGEPTLHPLFPQIASEIVAAGKVLYFPTNGLTLGSKPILDAIGDTPRVSISLDAWDEESYKRIRTGDWSRVIAAIRKFRQAKPNAYLHSQFTAGSYNIDGFPQFLQVLVDEGFNEAIMRFVQTHTIAREDVSLRFAKDRTEKAIYAAQLIAEKASLPLTVERRPYSEFNTESVGDASPVSRLSRYLDFVPMESISCPTHCTTTLPASTTITTSYDTLGGNMNKSTTIISSVVICTDSVGSCTTATVNEYTTQAWTYETITLSQATYTYNELEIACTNTTIAVVSGTTTSIICTTNTYIVTVGTLDSTTNTTIINSIPITTTCTTVIGTMSEGDPEIVSTVQVVGSEIQQLGQQFETESVTPLDQKPVVGTPAAIIAWHDGKLTSCFAMHEVGNVLTNSWQDVIRNPRYQAFLHRRAQMGGLSVQNEPWCAQCTRAY